MAGRVTVLVTMTDGAGTPLDRTGTYTTGVVDAKWVSGGLTVGGDAGPPSYRTFTQRPHAPVDGGVAVPMPDADVGGTWTEIDTGQGTYSYVFGATLPSDDDRTQTHTVGVWATRVFEGQTYVVNTVFDFIPAGGVVTQHRDVVTTTACNQCHNALGYHEGDTARRKVELCVLCHASGVVDVSNGNPLDLGPMVHRIHRGKFLASVDAGVPYALTEEVVNTDAGADGGVTGPGLVDHSEAWFPGSLETCKTCHQGARGDVWETTASRAACGGCHDGVSFSYPSPAPWMKLHSGGAQADDRSCLQSSCHGSADRFSIAAVHTVPSNDPAAPALALVVDRVSGTAPGQTPIVHFSVTENGLPLDILAHPLPWLAVTLAGPTTDYDQGETLTHAMQASSGAEGTLALDGVVGSYAYTFPAPIAAGASGSYAIGLEGYLQPVSPSGPIYAALNPVVYVGVTDPVGVPRRTVVERAKCNACHVDMSAHGGTRKSPEYCVLCHTPGAVDEGGVARFEVPKTVAAPLNFKVMVHKIHRGERLTRGYVVGGAPLPTSDRPAGTPIDFGRVAYPGDLRACWACHASTSYLPPLADGLSATLTSATFGCLDTPLVSTQYCATRTLLGTTSLGPLGAACTACHDETSTVAHAEVNTAPDGTESCATCHGRGAIEDTQVVHALPP
jgi:OmcA/MtrC family decaheme c-type cytochrome